MEIGSYPKKYETFWKLRNGSTVLLRPIKPEDEPYMDKLFKTFSEETVKYRFFQVLKEMPHEALARYVEAYYDKEIAVVVSDRWQRLGLGSKLVDYMIEIAREKRLNTLSALMLRENYKAIRFMRKKGFRTEGGEGETVRGVLKL